MTTTIDRLLELAAEYEAKATGLRLAVAELNGHQTAKKRENLSKNLQTASQIRRGHHQKTHKLPSGVFTKAAVYVLNQAKHPLPLSELRARVEERLAAKVNGNAAFATLTRYGYAKKTKDGYIATDKTPLG